MRFYCTGGCRVRVIPSKRFGWDRLSKLYGYVIASWKERMQHFGVHLHIHLSSSFIMLDHSNLKPAGPRLVFDKTLNDCVSVSKDVLAVGTVTDDIMTVDAVGSSIKELGTNCHDHYFQVLLQFHPPESSLKWYNMVKNLCQFYFVTLVDQ